MCRMVQNKSVPLSQTTTQQQPFYGPFSGTTRVSRCQKKTSGLSGAREDQQRQTSTIRLGATPSGPTSAHLHHPPIVFYRPDALPAAQPTMSKQCVYSLWKSLTTTLLQCTAYCSVLRPRILKNLAAFDKVTGKSTVTPF